MNSHALDHKGAMVNVYSKMKPNSFKSQLQAVLTANYKDIHGVQGASGCPKTSTRSSSSKLRTKRMLDQRQTMTQPPTQLLTLPPPPSRRTGACQPQPAGWGLQAVLLALPVALPPALGARASVWHGPM